MLGVTADTNVYISALNFGGRPLHLLDLARRGEIRLSISEPILAEIVRVLREKFGWEEEPLQAVETRIRGFTELVTPSRKVNAIAHDEPDNRILECAVEAKSDYIVSGDGDLLRLRRFEGVPVVRVAEFLREVGAPGQGR